VKLIGLQYSSGSRIVVTVTLFRLWLSRPLCRYGDPTRCGRRSCGPRDLLSIDSEELHWPRLRPDLLFRLSPRYGRPSRRCAACLPDSEGWTGRSCWWSPLPVITSMEHEPGWPAVLRGLDVHLYPEFTFSRSRPWVRRAGRGGSAAKRLQRSWFFAFPPSGRNAVQPYSWSPREQGRGRGANSMR